jgi:hypothetical protein
MMPPLCVVPVVPGGLPRPRRWRVVFLLGLALSLGCVTRGQAATTWTVCASGCNYTRIKAAIAAPTTSDGDTLAIGAGVYTEPGIVVDKSLTLQGEAAATTIVQAAATQGMASDRVFTIASGVTVTLQALTIRYGQTNENGGGLSNAGTLSLIHSTVSGNTVWGSYAVGGGLYNASGTLTLIHSTVSGNTTTGGGDPYGDFSHGGGLYNASGTLSLTHSTVSGNTTTDSGGGFYTAYGTLTLTSSIVANNMANNPDSGDCFNASGSVTSHGYNLDSDGSCQLTAPTDRPGTDPLLGPLQDNGGSTLTHTLLPDSPAIDAILWGTNGCGTTLYSDQRWQARPQPAGGACDIGAYEVAVAGQALSAWVAGLTPHPAVCENVTTGQAVTLSAPGSPWDCEAAGLTVRSGDVVALRVRGPFKQSAADVGGAVVGMAPNGGGCTNRTTGHQVKFEALFQGERGATAASCVAAGLVVQPGHQVQMRVQGAAE